MNTTDYFININTMFLFCIFTCGLLVWAVIRGYIIKGKLTKEQDSHLKATLINTKLNKALEDEKKVSENMEKLLRQVEAEVRDLQADLEHVDADRIELRAERDTLQNKLTDALAKVRQRNSKGQFVKRKPSLSISLSGTEEVKTALNEFNDAFDRIKAAQPKLTHGLTVKNPTEDEAKMIFDEARRLELNVESTLQTSRTFPWIWVGYDGEICSCVSQTDGSETFVTAKEFVQRMQNGRE